MGGQWPRKIRARLDAYRYTIGRARYRFLVLEGRVMQGGRVVSQCGPQCGRTMHARRFCNRYTIGYRSVSLYSTVGAGNAGRPVAADNTCPAGCVSLHHWACSVSVASRRTHGTGGFRPARN